MIDNMESAVDCATCSYSVHNVTHLIVPNNNMQEKEE